MPDNGKRLNFKKQWRSLPDGFTYKCYTGVTTLKVQYTPVSAENELVQG